MKSFLTQLLSLSVIFVAACSKTESVVDVTKKSDAIVGGVAVSPELVSGAAVIKSTVALMTVRNEKLFAFCSGTLIGPDLVLTAGHCTKVDAASSVLVFFGTALPTDIRAAGLVRAASYAVNPGYDATLGRFNDVALIKLEKPAPTGFSPASLLDPSFELKQGSEILLAGFGLIQDLPTPVRSTVLNLVRVKVAEIQDTIVVTDQNAGHGACAGDSGGPALPGACK